MPNEAYAAIRKDLEAERDNIAAQMAELGGDGAHLDYNANFADTSQVTAEKGENANLVQSLRETMEAIDATVKRIDADDFGTCENCGKAIAPARLEAQPTATHCIDCASAR